MICAYVAYVMTRQFHPVIQSVRNSVKWPSHQNNLWSHVYFVWLSFSLWMMLVSQLLYSVHVWRTDLKLSTTTTTPPGWGWGHASPELFKIPQLLLLLLGGGGDMLPQNWSYQNQMLWGYFWWSWAMNWDNKCNWPPLLLNYMQFHSIDLS